MLFKVQKCRLRAYKKAGRCFFYGEVRLADMHVGVRVNGAVCGRVLLPTWALVCLDQSCNAPNTRLSDILQRMRLQPTKCSVVVIEL